jgi:hypothetical protein
VSEPIGCDRYRCRGIYPSGETPRCMAVFAALRRSPGAVVRNPVLLVPILAVVLVQLPTVLLQSVNPILASVASLVVSLVFVAVVPFLQAGLLAMADEALDGPTSLATFVDSGKQHYVPVLVAYLAILAVNAGIGMVGIIVALAGGAAILGAGAAGSSLPVAAAIAVLVALIVLGYLAVVFLVQFYGQAIVLEDLGAVEGLKRSVAVVRGNLAGSLGYAVVAGVLGGIVGAGIGVGSALTSAGRAPSGGEAAPPAAGMLPELSLPVVIAIGVAAIALLTLVSGVLTVFSVAFYREVTA